MCRFVSYIGEEKLLISDLIDNPSNSLINQSREARESKRALNADGFGLAWYNHKIDLDPGIFKSTQPAWNDSNLKHIANKIASTCFLGHIRASTVGDVTLNNCHPFYYKNYTFVHNGTISHFEKVRRSLINELDEDLFTEVKAQTDSEHLFFLIMHYLKHEPSSGLEKAVINAFKWIKNFQKSQDKDHFSRLNIVITDGRELIATRFVSKRKSTLSLHYTSTDLFNEKHTCDGDHTKNKAIVVASEKLTDYKKDWHEIPVNHFIHVQPDLSFKVKPF